MHIMSIQNSRMVKNEHFNVCITGARRKKVLEYPGNSVVTSLKANTVQETAFALLSHHRLQVSKF